MNDTQTDMTRDSNTYAAAMGNAGKLPPQRYSDDCNMWLHYLL